MPRVWRFARGAGDSAHDLLQLKARTEPVLSIRHVDLSTDDAEQVLAAYVLGLNDAQGEPRDDPATEATCFKQSVPTADLARDFVRFVQERPDAVDRLTSREELVPFLLTALAVAYRTRGPKDPDPFDALQMGSPLAQRSWQIINERTASLGGGEVDF